MKKRFISSFIEAKFLIARCLTLLILALLSTNYAWGMETELSESLDLTGKTVGSNAYNSSTTYGDWTIVYGANNNKGWAYFKMGGKSETISNSNPCYIYYSANSGVSSKVDKIIVSIAAGSLSKSGMSVNSWGVYVYSDKAMTTQIDYVAGGTITKDAATFEFTPSAGKTWGKGYYYKVSWDLANTTSTNGIVCVDKVTLYSISDAPDPVLQSIAISGTPKTTYEAGEEFDITGLVVTGTYDTKDPEVITEGISWEVTPSGALTVGTTSVSVTATVDGKSDTKNYDVTVTAALPKITITKTSSGITTSYSSSTFTQNEVTFAYTDWMSSTDFIQAKASTSPSLQNTTAMPGKITKIQVVTGSGKTARAVTIKAGTTSTVDDMVSITSPTTSMDMVFDFGETNYTYFCLSTPGNACYFDKIVISYEEDKTPTIKSEIEEIEFEQKELSGTVTDSKTISATGKNLTAAISASMKSGSAAVFSVTPVGTPTAAEGEFTVSYSTTEAGEYSGTVVLSSGKTSIEIPVSASVVAHIPVLQSIYVKGEPTKKEYYVGEAFETDGLEVWGKYDVGDDQQITEGIEWEVTPATFSATTETSVSVVAKALEKASEAFAVTGLTVGAAPQIATYDFTTNLYGHTGVSSGSDNHDGDIAVDEVFTEAPTQIKFIKKGSTVTRFWDANSKHELRLYTNSEFNISGEGYNITKVEFSGSAANFTVDDVAIENKIWSGKNKTVTFKTTSTSNINSIKVYYVAAAPSAATPTITPSTEAETYWEPITVTLASTTEGATIYYTTDGTEPTAESTLYEAAFEVSKTTTIKAIAVKEGLDNSEVATKEFKFGAVFTSLEDLAAAELTKGTTVKVSFSNVEIKSIFTSGAGKRQGIFFDIQKGGKDIEIYYASVEVPETWVAGGKVSGTMTCPWTEFNGTWELAPKKDSWTWTNLTYVAPKATMSITDAKWGTFCAPFDVELDEGVKAYTASEESGTIKFTEVDGTIEAGTPVVVYKDVTETYTKDYSAAVEDFNETCQKGALVGVYAAKSGITAETGYTNYVLQNNGGVVGFYKATSTISLKANRCYMTLPTSSAAKDGFSFEDIITGINEILNPTKKSAEGIFDLNGRKLATPQKGINIINGVKVIVK